MRKNTPLPGISRLLRPALILFLFIAGITAMILPLGQSSANSDGTPDSKPETRNTTGAGLSMLPSTPPTNAFLNFLSPPVAVTIATYAGDCSTPKTVFNLQDTDLTVCAKITGGQTGQVIIWSNAKFVQVQNEPLGDGESSFTLSAASSLGDWRIILYEPLGGSVYALTPFTVVDAANPSADLAVFKSSVNSPVTAGSQAVFEIQVTNYGPTDATTVQLTDNVPTNAAFTSFALISGPAGTNCVTPGPGGGGQTICTIPTLARGETASFAATYDVEPGAGTDSIIASTATVSNDVVDPNDDNDSSTGIATVTGTTSETCTVDCPANIVVTANTTQDGVPGAFVTYGAATVNGNCGAVTNSPASGSFLTVGTHSIISATESGPSCTFTVTVLDTAPPSIMCPAHITATAPVGATDFVLPGGPGTPTINASGGGTVVGVRSDDVPPSTDEDGNPVPGVIHAVTDPYPLGSTGILWTVTDAGGRTASCSQTINIISAGDRDPVSITCPANVSVTAPNGTCEATISLATIGTPTTNPADNVTLTPRRSDDLPLTDPFPAGMTTITWTATDDINGNVASCIQSVNVAVPNSGDTTAPVLTVPDNVTVTTNSCTATLDDELGVATATDAGACNGSVTVTRTGVPPNFVFPTGTTTILYTATDAAGNSATGVQLVTVTEAVPVPPTITAPADVVVATGPGATSCGTMVTNAALGVATANDNCPGVTITRTGVPAGNIFPVGTTTVTYTATDASGNTATDTQTVTVNDNTIPVVTAPAPVTLFTGPGSVSCGVTVADLDSTIGPGSATDNCPGVGPVTRTGVPAGNVFPVGTTVVTYSATDAHGNTGSATQTVTVVDNTPPTISCPTDIIADYDPAVNGAVVTFTAPVGADNCASNTTQTAGLASGSTFPVGTTTNTFTVTDASGNTAQCSFKVTVALTSVIGLDSASLSGGAMFDSYNSSGGYPATKGSLANLLSNGTVSVAGSSKVYGNVWSTQAGVSVLGSSQVMGNATAGTTVTKAVSAVITGTITNNQVAPVMTLPAVPNCGTYSSNSGISGTYSYNAATGNLSLSGINNATLANGSYCFNNVTLSNSAQLRVNGPVTIRITGKLTVGGVASLTNTTSVPANLRILSSYSGSNGVSFTNSSNIYLMLYAPNTNVADTGAAQLFGTVVGKTVTLSNSGTIHYDTQLKNAWPDIWTLILGP